MIIPGKDERRDIFYDLVEEQRAALQLAELEAEAREESEELAPTVGVALAQAADPDDERDAERFAAEAVSEVEGHLRNRSWDRGMQTAQRRLRQLRGHRERYPDNKRLRDGETSLEQLFVLAEDRKLHEEAQAQFMALGLRLEGILWSAEEGSLALISGEPVARRIDDRVRGAVIKAIDRNRVDFVYPYRKRRYHFQLYLEPKE
jgi:hypothetical protein